MGKKTFIKTTRFKNKMAEKALEGEKLGLPTWERRIKKGPPPTVNNKKGKSKEFIEQIEKLETQAERNRPLINLAKAEEAEEGEIIPKTKRKGLTQTFTANDTELETIHYYPRTIQERDEFINPVTKRKVTEFQYKVYDLLAQVPRGQVTSYKVISDLLKSNARAVGNASRLNPFWPLPVPCHRIICSDGFIGGVTGTNEDSQFLANKKAKLVIEGNEFDEKYNFIRNSLGNSGMFDKFILE